jgi:hypothetical protein
MSLPILLDCGNDRDHPARAVDSTQVKTADRGLGVHRLVIAFLIVELDIVTDVINQWIES